MISTPSWEDGAARGPWRRNHVHGAAFMAPVNFSCRVAFISLVGPVVGRARVLFSFSQQMKVQDSTRATSEAWSERGKEFRRFSSLSLVVRYAAHRPSERSGGYSSWNRRRTLGVQGWSGSAISATHLMTSSGSVGRNCTLRPCSVTDISSEAAFQLSGRDMRPRLTVQSCRNGCPRLRALPGHISI